MTTETTHFFTYNKKQFEEVISYFDSQSIKDIRVLIEKQMSNTSTSPELKDAVSRRVISYKTGRNWWFKDDEDQTSKTTQELVAIWKLVLASKKEDYGEETIDNYSYERLELIEKKVADGKINENDFKVMCESIKRQKEIDEVLIDCCACCCIGSRTIWEKDSPLRILCLPCGWDSHSVCVKFS